MDKKKLNIFRRKMFFCFVVLNELIFFQTFFVYLFLYLLHTCVNNDLLILHTLKNLLQAKFNYVPCFSHSNSFIADGDNLKICRL